MLKFFKQTFQTEILPYAQEKTQKMAILTVEEKAQSKMQHSKAKEKFRGALTLGKKKCESATRKGSGRIQRSYDTREKTGSKIAACSGKDSKDNNSNSR